MTTRQDALAAALAATHTGSPADDDAPLYGGSGSDMAADTGPTESLDSLAQRMFNPPRHAVVYGQ